MLTESLGIRGWGKTLDRLVITSIITGDPLLMLSNYGQGKTALIDRLGQVIIRKLKEDRPGEELIVAVVNAATANPQDWAGYFIPPKDGGTTMELLKSPMSLLDAVLIAIDEISRAATRNQNNVLSLIQERRVDGIPTKCEMIFAMMNPVVGDDADEGSEPLIGAVADRFALLIEPPEFHQMSATDKKEVVYSAYKPSTADSMFSQVQKKLGKDAYVVPDTVVDDIWKFLLEAKKLYIGYCFDDKHRSTSNAVVEYTTNISTMLTGDTSIKHYFSGRRGGMLPRAILANHAIGMVLGEPDLPMAAEQVILHSLMNKAMGKTYNPQVVRTAHQAYARILRAGSTAMTAILAEPDKLVRLKMAFKSKLKPDEFTRIYKDMLASFTNEIEAEFIVGMALIEELASQMSKHELSVIAKRIIDATGLPIKEIYVDMRDEYDAAILTQFTDDVHSSRIMAICVHLNSVGAGSVIDLWSLASEIYFRVRSVL